MEGCSKIIEEYSFRTRNLEFLFNEDPRNEDNERIPKPRSGHRVVASEAFMFSYGGYNPAPVVDYIDQDEEQRIFKEVWSFNFARRQWAKIEACPESFPIGLASSGVKRLDNMMIIHGGTGFPFGVLNSNDTHVAPLQSGAIKKLTTTGEIPPPMYGQACAIDEEKKLLYVLGGTSGLTFTMDLYCLDLKTLSWSKIQPSGGEVPEGRYRHEVAMFGSKMVVFGGGTLEKSFDLQSLPVFDLVTRTWDTMWTKGHKRKRAGTPLFPKPRRCFAGDLIHTDDGDATYVLCGGFDGRRSFKDIWTLSLRTRRWTKWRAELPGTLYFHDAALSASGRLVVFGGITGLDLPDAYITNGSRTNHIISCWVTIPKLSEIAWEAMLHYAPHIRDMSSKEVTRLGIPPSFASRLD